MKQGFILILFAIAISVPPFMLDDTGRHDIAKPAGSRMEGVTVRSVSGGELLWRLNARKVVFDPVGDLARLEAIEAELPKENMRIAADGGQYDTGSMNLSLSGNVRAESRDIIVTTDHMTLKDHAVIADDLVAIKGKGFSIVGRGLVVSGNSMRIASDVKAIVR